MLSQYLYTVEYLHKSRAAELQQRALEERLLKGARQNSEGLFRRVFSLSVSLITMFF